MTQSKRQVVAQFEIKWKKKRYESAVMPHSIEYIVQSLF